MARQRARRTSPLYLPSAFDLFAPSRDLFIKHFNVFGVLFILPMFFWLHNWVDTPAGRGHYLNRISDANFSWSSFPGAYFAIFIGFSILWFIFILAVGTAIQIMLQKAQLDAVEDKQPSIGKSWAAVKGLGWRLLGLYIIIGLAVGVGLLLLIVPGLFMLRRYMFAPYAMLEKKCTIKEALEESHSLGLVNTGSVWGLIGVMFLIGLVGILPLIGSLASFVLGALYSIAPALRYQQLKKLA